VGTRQSVTPSATPKAGGSPQNVDPEMLENLDMLTNMDLLKEEKNWDAFKTIPQKAYEDPDLFYNKIENVLPSEEKK
jgi:hypothetical protein